MADNKNQHFVPKCLLRQFACDTEHVVSERRSLNLYNLNGDRLIPNAPLKTQASGNYMYGKDLRLERMLSGLEGIFSTNVLNVVNGKESKSDLDYLRFFAYLQRRRTELAVQHLRESWDELDNQVYGAEPRPPSPDRHGLMMQSLKLCMETKDFIKDLRVRVIQNDTRQEFIVSDDPSVFANRFAAKSSEATASAPRRQGFCFCCP